MTVAECAALFGRSESTIQRWVKAKRLKGWKSWRKVSRWSLTGKAVAFHHTVVLKLVIDGRHAKALHKRELFPPRSGETKP